jgi:hypothetical protein
MTNKAQAQAIAESCASILDERFSGYALVGYVAGTDEPVTVINIDGSSMRCHALRTMLDEAEYTLERALKGDA